MKKFAGCSVFVLCLLAPLTGAGTPPDPPDVSGQWNWEEEVSITIPADFAVLFGVLDPKGPIVHIRCQSWGTMDLVQSGASFGGSATQSATCATSDGQDAPTPPFPPGWSVDGTIVGGSIHFLLDVGGGIVCTYRGSISESGEIATRIRAQGDCDVPAPFRPNTDHKRFRATR
jgi:hypothetical protein